MRESGYYPPGAEFDPDAPWNEPVIPEKSFDVTISTTLSKATTVDTDQYIPYVDHDEDGCYAWEDTSDTNWEDVYNENHYTALGLINKFKEFLEKYLPDPIVDRSRYMEFKHLIEECEDWEEDEIEVVKD